MIFKIRCAKLSANSRVDLSLIVNYHREEIGDIQAIKKNIHIKQNAVFLLVIYFSQQSRTAFLKATQNSDSARKKTILTQTM